MRNVSIAVLCGILGLAAASGPANAVGKQAWLDLNLPDADGQSGGTGGMNSHNTIAGFYSKTDGSFPGFVRTSDGTLSTFVPVDGGYTVVSAINASDTVVGYVNGGAQGFMRTADGQITILGNEVVPTSINDSGQIAGSSYINNHWLGFIREVDGTINTFPSPDGSILNVQAINKWGATTGQYGNGAHAFFRAKDGTFTSFDVPGATYVYLVGITKDDTIAGYWLNSNAYHGFIRHPDGTIENIDVPGSKSGSTFLLSINDHGIIVGQYSDSTSHTRGFARSPSGAYVTLDAPGATRGTWIDHIAPDGKMTGHYYDTPNHIHLVRANKSLTGF